MARRRPPAPKPPATGNVHGSVQVPSGEPVAYVFVENVRVTEPAVTGLIYRCWLT